MSSINICNKNDYKTFWGFLVLNCIGSMCPFVEKKKKEKKKKALCLV